MQKIGCWIHTCVIMIRFVARTYQPCWVLKARIQKHRGKPLLFHDKCPGFFYVHYTTGPTALRPIRRTKQLWLSVLLKDTSAMTGQARIQTHILATPELESNALDRSATTCHFRTCSSQFSLDIFHVDFHKGSLHY